MNRHDFSIGTQFRNVCILVLSVFLLISLAGCPAAPTAQPTQTPELARAPAGLPGWYFSVCTLLCSYIFLNHMTCEAIVAASA